MITKTEVTTLTEKKLTVCVKHIIEKLHPLETVVYELKMVKKKSFNFKVVADHQILGLQTALKGYWYKLPDMSAKNGKSPQKPFDAVWIMAGRAYVCPIFYVPRKKKTMYLIPISKFVKLEGKSATEEDLASFPSIEL